MRTTKVSLWSRDSNQTASGKPGAVHWSHMKRTGVARTPLRRGEKLKDKVEHQLAAIKKLPELVRSFFKAPSVAYITDC
jgi:hypothetical protein